MTFPRVDIHNTVPSGELWLVGPKGVLGKIVNIGVSEPAPLKIGDWPWPAPQKGKRL